MLLFKTQIKPTNIVATPRRKKEDCTPIKSAYGPIIIIPRGPSPIGRLFRIEKIRPGVSGGRLTWMSAFTAVKNMEVAAPVINVAPE
jgi:hypothetical protein